MLILHLDSLCGSIRVAAQRCKACGSIGISACVALLSGLRVKRGVVVGMGVIGRIKLAVHGIGLAVFTLCEKCVGVKLQAQGLAVTVRAQRGVECGSVGGFARSSQRGGLAIAALGDHFLRLAVIAEGTEERFGSIEFTGLKQGVGLLIFRGVLAVVGLLNAGDAVGIAAQRGEGRDGFVVTGVLQKRCGAVVHGLVLRVVRMVRRVQLRIEAPCSSVLSLIEECIGIELGG